MSTTAKITTRSTMQAILEAYGFRHTRSMRGGIEAWSLEVDAGVPRYESALGHHGTAALRPLHSVVSQTL